MQCEGANTYIISVSTLVRRLSFIEAVQEERQRERNRAKGFCCRETQPSAADLVNPAATPLSSQLTATWASRGAGGKRVGGVADGGWLYGHQCSSGSGKGSIGLVLSLSSADVDTVDFEVSGW